MREVVRSVAAALVVAGGLCVFTPASLLRAQEPASGKSERNDSTAPRTKDGKRLLTALDTLKIRGVGAPQLSPDGKWIAYTVSELQVEKDKEWKTVTQIWLVGAAGGTARQFTRGERSVSAPTWSPDGKQLAFFSDREKAGERQVWAMWADGGEAWEVTNHKGGASGFRFSPDGKKLVLTATDQPSKEEEARKKDKDDTILIDRDIKMSHLWLWDVEKKEAKRLTEGDFTCGDPRWSPDGTRISFTTNPSPKADDGGLTDIWVLDTTSGQRRKLVENPGSDQAARWSPDGKWIAYNSNPETHNGVSQTHLQVIPVAGGAPRKLTHTFELDAGAPTWSADGKTIYFSSTVREAAELFACDLASGGIRQLSRSGGTINISDISDDGRTLVGTISTAKQSGEVFRADAEMKSIERVTTQNPWLKEFAIADSEIVTWKSKDGLEIEGVLTKPVGFDPAKKYPFLLNPHGGPTGSSLNNFNAQAQLMAANGYLVLQPNFRGSTGKGAKFAAANKNTWGKGDYEDCMSGVQTIVDRGWADPDRLGAFGWSYGGYMTYWILTQTDRFKAVSPGAGLTNIYAMYSQNDIQRYLRWFYNDQSPWDNQELYWDRSPMKYVKNVKTPTMIMHGQQDTRVPIAQAQEFYRALVERSVPVDFVVYPREGHGFTEPRHNLDRLRRYLAFFGKYLNNPSITETGAEEKSKPTSQQ